MTAGAPWRRAARNAGKLAAGRMVNGALTLLALALAARELGAAGLGHLTVIQSLVVGIATIVRFDTAATVVRYGADMADPGRLNRLLRFTLGLDGLAAVVAATAAIVAVLAGSGLFALPPEARPAALVYAAGGAVVVLNGTPRGILHLHDRFGSTAAANVVTPALRAFGAGALLLVNGGLSAFLLLWVGSQAASRGVLAALAAGVAHGSGVLRAAPAPDRPVRHPEPGIWPFAWGLNATRALSVVGRHGTMLLAGALLGPAGAGLVRIAREIGEAVRQPVEATLKPAVLREVANPAAAGRRGARRATVLRTAAAGGGIAVVLCAVVVIGGPTLIPLVFGPAYEGVYATAVLVAVANVMSVVMVPVRQVVIASGRMRFVVGVPMITATVYMGTLAAGFLTWGVLGLGVATLVRLALGAVLISAAARLVTRERGAAAAPGGTAGTA